MINISDIAELAGVSVATVSLAINNKKGVGKDTRERILKIVEETNYKPLRVSKPKEVRKSNTKINIKFLVAINNAVINSNFRAQPFFSSLVDTLVNDSANDNLDVIISAVDSNDLTSEILQYNDSESTDGLIILATDLQNNDLDYLTTLTNKPMLFLDSVYKLLESSSIGINNIQGTYIALDYLTKMGHTSIGYVMSENRINNFNERLNAFEEYSHTKNLDVDLENHIIISPNIIDTQESIAKQINKNRVNPTAYFCENDVLAISFMKSMIQLGYKVPDEISIIGFDNIRESNVISPELTTIEVNQDTLIESAVKQIISIIENNSTDQHIFINCKLIERNSVQQLSK